MMREEESERSDLIGPLAWGRSLPYVPAAASDRLGWVGLEAARYRALPAAEHIQPALTHHQLVLFVQPPDAFALRYEGVTRHVPPPPFWGRFFCKCQFFNEMALRQKHHINTETISMKSSTCER